MRSCKTEIETISKNQVERLDVECAISEHTHTHIYVCSVIAIALLLFCQNIDILASSPMDLTWLKKESLKLKIDQYKPSSLKEVGWEVGIHNRASNYGQHQALSPM